MPMDAGGMCAPCPPGSGWPWSVRTPCALAAAIDAAAAAAAAPDACRSARAQWCKEAFKEYKYIGLTESTFKRRWYGHCQTFKDPKLRLATELSKLVWELKDKNTEFNIRWTTIQRARSYNQGRSCNLCTSEKYWIVKTPESINTRNELISKCRHMRKFLIDSNP